MTTRGSAPDLMLLHGWSTDGSVWGRFAEDLARDFRVCAPDLPGHGASPRTAPVTLDGLVGHMLAWMPPNALVCGWSLGALVALQLARRHPERVRALLLLSPTPRFCAADDWPHGVPARVLADFAGQLETDAAALLARFRAMMCRGDAHERRLRRELGSPVAPAARPADRQALREGLDVLRTTDLRDALAGIAAPALVVHGNADQVVPADAGIWLAANLPRAHAHILDACGHLPFRSQPEACATLVRQFAGELPPPP